LDKPYPQLSREYILKINPDVIFGGDFEKMEASFFKLYPELKLTIAYRNKWVFELNDDLASRPGPRFLEGIREIEQKLNLVR
jgi:iron complex transport system substrate-binding protein